MLNKDTESMMTFIIDKDVKEEFSKYCKDNDVTKSKILRENVRTWLDYMKQESGELNPN